MSDAGYTEGRTISDFFGTEEPEHVGEGIGMGLKSMAKGVFAGVAGLVLQPVAGAEKEGFTGAAKGFVKGVAGVVLLPVAGIGYGLMQMGQGIINTPEAVKEALESDSDEEREEASKKAVLTRAASGRALVVDEKLYDEARKKVMDAAVLEAGRSGQPKASAASNTTPETSKAGAPGAGAEVSKPPSAVSAGAGGGNRAGELQRRVFVAETELYDVLEVAPDASPGQIKKAYYKLAKEFHPDKNAGDSFAKEKFQLVGEAYQVLSDPERREKYDRHGRAALDDTFMDPGAFFTMAFGADAFKDLVGELAIAYTASRSVSEEELEEFQTRREEELSTKLMARLQQWVDGDQEGFVTSALAEAEQLSQQPFGQAMLISIGYTYEKKADTLLGLHYTPLGIPGHLGVLRQNGHVFKSKYRAAAAALKMQDLKKKLDDETPDEQARLSAEALPVFLDSIWLVSILDIESTLRHVVTKVVLDETVDKEVRRQRAKALVKLGKIFTKA